MTSDTNLPDDEIDIRELFHTLIRYKWIVLGITLVAAGVVLVYSKFGSPKMYSSQAQVLFTKPQYTTNLETSIQGTPQVPEASVLKDLALDDELLHNVYTSTVVTAALGKNVDFEIFKTNMTAKLTGTSKLYLVVTAKQPETSALIVDVWANMFITQVNTLYSVNEKSKALISNEVIKAREKWGTAEQTLLDNLPNGMADMKKIELTNKQYTFTAYLNSLTQLDLIMKDAHSLQSRLPTGPDNSQLGIEYQLSLIGLYQRATGGLDGVQVQIAAPTVENVRTVAKANDSLNSLISSLDAQREQLQDNLDQLRQNIISATVELETANYQLTQLTTERDLALNAYQALSAQLEEIQIDLAREDVVAKIVGQALPPETPISNRTLMKTVIAGALAFVLSCFGVLLINWWKSPSPAKPTS